MTSSTKPNRTKMLWLRTTDEERAKLDHLAKTLGFGNASKLVRSRFPEVFTPNEGSASTGRSQGRGATKAPDPYHDLIAALAERTGRPRSLLRQAVAQGRVTAAGTPVDSLDDPVLKDAPLELDGQPV